MIPHLLLRRDALMIKLGPASLSPAADDGVDADSTDLEGDGQRFNPAELFLRPGMDAVVADEVFLSMVWSLSPGRASPIKLSSPE